MILNPDTELRPGTLHALLEAAAHNPDALITPKLLCPDGRVNACGNEMHYTGLVSCLGLGRPSHHFHGLHEVPLLSGAALLARTETLQELGGFDEQYFMYHEDTDLSLRARLLGFRLLCLADAVVIHHYRLGMSPSKLFYLERNRLITLFKVLQRRTLVQLLPALLLTELATWAFAVRSVPYLKARTEVYRWLWQHRTTLAGTRRGVQRTRQCSDAELLASSSLRLPIGEVAGQTSGRLLNAVLIPVYRLLKPASLRRMA